MCKTGEERRFNGLALVGRKLRKRFAQGLGLLALLEHVARIGSQFGLRLHLATVAALLSAVEAQAVDRPRAGLVHDPAEHRAVRRIVTRSAPPDVMEDVDGEVFSGLPVGRDWHGQREEGAWCQHVKRLRLLQVASAYAMSEP